MGVFDKIAILGPSAQYDTCGPKDFGNTTKIPGVYYAKTANGGVCRLFKVLQSNSCQNNCNYCAYRRDRACARTTATPDEMASAFMQVHSQRLVDGLFLSSGIVKTPIYAMTRMLDTVNILRKKLNYRGYIHFKIMPGADDASIEEALKLSNRISLNIEAPTEESLAIVSPDKHIKRGNPNSFFDTLARIRIQVNKLKHVERRVPSLTTQFIVGAGEETDRDIIKMAGYLYKNYGLYRTFFSAFRPVTDTPLEDKPQTQLEREHRLYQTDFLMRFYKYSPSEIPFENGGFLNGCIDPKSMWANQNKWFFPVNLNSANYFKLLRIPGIGPQAAKKIMNIRKYSPITDINQLRNMRIQLTKAQDWLTL